MINKIIIDNVSKKEAKDIIKWLDIYTKFYYQIKKSNTLYKIIRKY